MTSNNVQLGLVLFTSQAWHVMYRAQCKDNVPVHMTLYVLSISSWWLEWTMLGLEVTLMALEGKQDYIHLSLWAVVSCM